MNESRFGRKEGEVATLEPMAGVKETPEGILGKNTKTLQGDLDRIETSLTSEVGQISEKLGVELSPSERQDLAAMEGEISAEASLIRLKVSEEVYLSRHPDRVNLEGRYTDPRTEAGFVLNQAKEFAARARVEYRDLPELAGQAYGPSNQALINGILQEQVLALFLDKKRGTFNPEKKKAVAEEAERYLALLLQAQEEGDVATDVSATDVLKMLEENLAKLAMQDRAATENMLGDHGIRHLVGHNIRITERIFDQLSAQGQQVRAIDRLMAHQIMIDHDIGYAMDPVRGAINKEGIMGQDAGHNLLAAKLISDRTQAPDHFVRIFSPEQIATIHSGILEHDSSAVDFKVGDNSAEARRTNIESAIHLADNTHAFEDKLPEVLYGVPQTLETMRLMKTAGEIGDQALVGELKASLIDYIASSDEFSEDDKQALVMAARSLEKNSFKFNVGRICGNRPEITIDRSGKVHIEVEESLIHQEVVGLFGQQSYTQLKKFIADLSGLKKEQVSDEMLNSGSVDSKKLEIKLKIGAQRAGEKTDYQERIERLLSNEKFNAFSIEDDRLGAEQRKLESLLKDGVMPEIREMAAGLLRTGEGDTREWQEILEGRIAQLRETRRQNMFQYIQK